jgi:hypothetical protein
MIIGAGVEYGLSGQTVLLAGLQFTNGFLDAFDTDATVKNELPRAEFRCPVLIRHYLFRAENAKPAKKKLNSLRALRPLRENRLIG